MENKNKVVPIMRKSKIKLGEFVNKETGEMLLDEVAGANKVLSVKEDTGLVKIDRPDGSYGTFSAESIQVLMGVLNKSDLGSVLSIAVDIKTPLNVVYNNNIPHSHETLQRYLGIKSESMYMKLISRLVKAGVVYKLEGLIQGEVRKIILINPFLFAKRATFDKKVIEVFATFPISHNKNSKKEE